MNRKEAISLLGEGRTDVWNRIRGSNEEIPSLSGAKLSGAKLSGADLRYVDFSMADLGDSDLSRADLSEANLRGAILRGAILSEANLSEANLSGSNLSEANLRGADLFQAKLSGADLSGANLNLAKLSGANLSGANLSRANLRGANLSGANLSEANLRGADLRGAFLSGAFLSGANLSEANLGEADLWPKGEAGSPFKFPKQSRWRLQWQCQRSAGWQNRPPKPAGRAPKAETSIESTYGVPSLPLDNRPTRRLRALARRASLLLTRFISRNWRMADPVDCTVFAPPSVARGDWLSVQVFAHRPDQTEEAGGLAQEIDQEARRRGFKSLEMGIKRGTHLTFHLHVPGIEFDKSMKSLVWQGRPTYVHFLARASSEIPIGTVIGRVTVSRDNIPIGSIMFRLDIVEKNGPPRAPNTLVV